LTLLVLAIGIDAYKDKDLKLGCAVKDATGIMGVLKQHSGELFQVRPKLLTDAAATRKEILAALAWLKEEMGRDDVAVISYAGHGARVKGGNFYLLLQDFDGRGMAR